MKVLIVLALVAAASCAPSDRTKRNLFPAQYGASSPLITSDVQSNTLESSNYQASALKSTSSKSSLVQPFQQVYQPATYAAAYQPTTYTASYQPTTYTASYQPAIQASYQPIYNYQQPSYYSAPHVQTVPLQSQYYAAPQVQYVSQPEVVYSNRQVQTIPTYQTSYQPSYQLSGYSSGSVVNDPWC